MKEQFNNFHLVKVKQFWQDRVQMLGEILALLPFLYPLRRESRYRM